MLSRFIYSSPQRTCNYLRKDVGSTAIRLFGTKNDKRLEKMNRVQQKMQNEASGADLPTINDLLRQLYRRSHPDLLRSSYPEYADVNDGSLQILNGILSTIKSENMEGVDAEYPPQMYKTLPFYVKSGKQDGGIECFELIIRMTGGDSRKVLMKSFTEFFVRSGISKDGKFQWGKDYSI